MDDSMNFLNFWPSGVSDLIFQHLKPKEVLTASLVHPTWNDFLSTNSLTCWKGILVQPKDNDQLHYLVKSVRRYEHIKVVNVSAILPSLLEIFTKPGRKWKSIAIFRTDFETIQQLETILRVSARTVEQLELNSIGVRLVLAEATESFDFPQLKNLRISYHFLDEGPCWINCMMTSAENLETLQLAHACDHRMKALIFSAPKLKKLSLSGRFQDLRFFQDLAMNLPSRLEVFEFNDILSSSSENENLSHFNNFFKSQGKTLKKFETDALIELDEFESAFKMPNLHTLNIRGFYYNRDMVNSYLETLRLTSVPEASLKFVNIQTMDQNFLEILAINARGLLVLRASELLATDTSNPAWFPKLEKVHVFFLESELLKQILDKEEANRSRLERMILAGLPQEMVEIRIGNGVAH